MIPIGPTRTLEELKREAVLRADTSVYPMTGIDAGDTRRAMSHLASLAPDDWAAAWTSIADEYAEKAENSALSAPDTAARLFQRAWQTYYMARWPTDNSTGKKRAYQRSLAMFSAYARFFDPPLETVHVPFEGSEIVAYLRIPPQKPAPLVLGISGLDSRKEDMIEQLAALLPLGVAIAAVDMPGTGQAPIRAGVGAERMFSRLLDVFALRGDIDASRIVIRGQSFSGHWAAILAHTERQRIRGSVYHSGPIHGAFQPDWQARTLGSREYLFGLFEARAAVYGVRTAEEYLAFLPQMSLLARDLIGKPTAPMLLLGGVKDTQVPIEDLYLLLGSGTPKEAWVNPNGGHMGRSPEWPQPQIIHRIVTPWLLKALNGEVPPARAD